MNTLWNAAWILEEDIANVGGPPYGDQLPHLDEDMNYYQALVSAPPLTDGDIRDAFLHMDLAITTQAQAATTKSQAMTAQANRQVVPRPNNQVSTMTFHLRNFTMINPPTFYGSKVEEDPQELINENYKILYAMGLSTSEKAELSTYKLKDVALTWYVQWRENRPLRGGPVTWEVLKKAFIDRFFPREKMEANVVEFINLHQGGMSILEYSLKFSKLSKYAPSLVLTLE